MSEVKERRKLITAGYGLHRGQWVKYSQIVSFGGELGVFLFQVHKLHTCTCRPKGLKKPGHCVVHLSNMYNVHVKLVYQAPENVRDFSQKATFLFLVLDLNFMHLEMRAHVRKCH